MEAIMKAFEKMAKREERKKEASKVGTPRRATTDEDVIDTSEADSQKEEVKMVSTTRGLRLMLKDCVVLSVLGGE